MSLKKKMRSPGCRSLCGTRVPAFTWSQVVRGRSMPAALYAAWVRPEQSKELGPVAPHTYGLPSWSRAKAMTWSAFDELVPVLVPLPVPVPVVDGGWLDVLFAAAALAAACCAAFCRAASWAARRDAFALASASCLARSAASRAFSCAVRLLS